MDFVRHGRLPFAGYAATISGTLGPAFGARKHIIKKWLRCSLKGVRRATAGMGAASLRRNLPGGVHPPARSFVVFLPSRGRVGVLDGGSGERRVGEEGGFRW